MACSSASHFVGEIVELLLPDRIMKQFGLAHGVVATVDIGIELHHRERRVTR